jgi:hypothetical protein
MAEQPDPGNTLSDECFGFYFHQFQQEGWEWGYQRLEVNLQSDPTGQHYDPESLRVRIVDLDKRIDHVRIYHPWRGRERFQIVIDEVVLRDRKDKVVEAFTFGGQLSIQSDDQCTHCSLESPVPIIDLRDDNNTASLLAEEAIALIARRQAEWEYEPEKFEARLANASIEGIYFGVLKDLEKKYREFPEEERVASQDFLAFLQHQMDRTADMFDSIGLPSSLEEIV